MVVSSAAGSSAGASLGGRQWCRPRRSGSSVGASSAGRRSVGSRLGLGGLGSGFGCCQQVVGGRVSSGTPPCWSMRALQSVGEVAGQRFEQAGELHHRGSQRTGELGEQHLAGLHLGQGLGLVGGEGLRAQHAALHDEVRVGPGEVAQGLGHVDRIAGGAIGLLGDEGDRGGAGEQLLQLQAEVAGSEADERVLVDLVLAADLPQRPTQIADRGHVEPSVLGEQGCAGGIQALTHLVHHRDLLRSRVLHRHLLSLSRGSREARARRVSPRGVRLVRRDRGPFEPRGAPDVCGEQSVVGSAMLRTHRATEPRPPGAACAAPPCVGHGGSLALGSASAPRRLQRRPGGPVTTARARGATGCPGADVLVGVVPGPVVAFRWNGDAWLAAGAGAGRPAPRRVPHQAPERHRHHGPRRSRTPIPTPTPAPTRSPTFDANDEIAFMATTPEAHAQSATANPSESSPTARGPRAVRDPLALDLARRWHGLASVPVPTVEDTHRSGGGLGLRRLRLRARRPDRPRGTRTDRQRLRYSTHCLGLRWTRASDTLGTAPVPIPTVDRVPLAHLHSGGEDDLRHGVVHGYSGRGRSPTSARHRRAIMDFYDYSAPHRHAAALDARRRHVDGVPRRHASRAHLGGAPGPRARSCRHPPADIAGSPSRPTTRRLHAAGRASAPGDAVEYGASGTAITSTSRTPTQPSGAVSTSPPPGGTSTCPARRRVAATSQPEPPAHHPWPRSCREPDQPSASASRP